MLITMNCLIFFLVDWRNHLLVAWKHERLWGFHRQDELLDPLRPVDENVTDLKEGKKKPININIYIYICIYIYI